MKTKQRKPLLQLIGLRVSGLPRRKAAWPARPIMGAMLVGLLSLLLAAPNQASAQSTRVVTVVPAPGAANAPATASIVVTFNNAINPATVTANSLRVEGAFSGPHSGSFAFASGNKEVTFTPSLSSTVGEIVTIDVSSQITDMLGDAIRPWVSQFTVASDSRGDEFAPAVAYGTETRGQGIRACDFNRDGNLDLVVANYSYGIAALKNVSVLMGNGDATFNRVDYPTDPDTSPASVCTGDVDGDGHADIVAVNYNSDNVAVLTNNGLGVFGAYVRYPVGDAPYRAELGDMNGDGHLDLVVSHHTGLGVSLLTNNGNGTFAAPVVLPSGRLHVGLALADLDGDGRLDIVTGDAMDPGSFSVFINQGNGHFAAPISYPAGSAGADVAAADLNGDDAPDIVLANSGSGTITIYYNENNGTGTFAGRKDYPTKRGSLSPFGVTIADLDGSGFPEIITANYADRSVSVFRNFGKDFPIRKDFNIGGALALVSVGGDFDNDGDLDLVTANAHGPLISFLRNTPASISGRAFLDINGDCVENGLDEGPVGGRLVRLTADSSGVSRFTTTRADGNYAFVAPPGAYTVNLMHTTGTAESCNNPAGVTYHVNVTGVAPATGLNFGVLPDCRAEVWCDYVIPGPCPSGSPCTITPSSYPHGRHLCPCEQFTYAVTVYNSGASPLLPHNAVHPFIVQLALGPNVMFCNPFPNPIAVCNSIGNPTVTGTVPGTGQADLNMPPCNPTCNANTGQTVQWTLGNALPAGHFCTFFVTVQVANVPLNTVLSATPALIEAHCNPGNKMISATGPPCQDTVLCSSDPNDKKVSPAGCGPLGNVLPGTPLTYVVRFQNLGNAGARRVVIRDSLDPALDPGTVELLSSSHPLTSFEILPGGQMIWTFENISLPDANSDEPRSHGEVRYRVRPRSSAGEGTTILNSAAIYFDFNLPVITATTTNTIRSVPMPSARFSPAVVSTNGPWIFNFTYTGGTADGASFAWDFGTEATPLNSTAQNPAGISWPTDGPKLVSLTVTRYGCVETNQSVVWVGPCDGIPTMSLQRLNNQVIVSWTECGILQVAENMAGPWRDIVARSPYTVDLSGRQRFYRTRK